MATSSPAYHRERRIGAHRVRYGRSAAAPTVRRPAPPSEESTTENRARYVIVAGEDGGAQLI